MHAIHAQPFVQKRATPAGPRILQVLPELTGGGVERGTLDMARHLRRAGWQPLVASRQGELVRELVGIGVPHLDLPMESKNPLVMLANAVRLERLIRHHDIDLVHARSRAPAWSARLAARRARVPFVTTFHGVYSGSEKALKRGYNSVMASGDRVIAISDYVAAHVRERYGVGEDRLRTIHRGVDLTEFDPDIIRGPRIAALADRWRVEAGPKIVMLPGRITRIKGHALLLEAVARLERSDFIVLLVGHHDPASSYTREVGALVERYKLGDRVRFAGPCDDMATAYQLADVVVAPSIGPEAFGRVSVEAQAMGKPVIVTDIGGLGETMLPASTGWLLTPDDAGELAEALDHALSLGEEALGELAVRARDFVAGRFTAERMCDSTIEVYAELLQGTSRYASLESNEALAVHV